MTREREARCDEARAKGERPGASGLGGDARLVMGEVIFTKYEDSFFVPSGGHAQI